MRVWLKKKIIKKINNKLLKGDKVDIKKFTQKTSEGLRDPKTGWTIEKDTANHGRRVWKLKNKAGNRIASLGEDGKILAK